MVYIDFYDMAASEEEARAAPLDSQDAQALKKSGVYYFALVNGVNSVKIDKKNLETNAKMAIDYFEAAYKLNSQDPIILTWRAAANLAYAGVSKELKDKIKHANLGINYFNQIPKNQRDSLDYLYMRIVSFIQVPKDFKDLTRSVKKDSQTYMRIYSSAGDVGFHVFLKESVKVMHAYACFITSKKNEAREIMLTIDEALMLKGRGTDTSTAEYYCNMKKEIKY